MARYKGVHYDQDKFILVSFRKQIQPGTFEYTLNYPIDHELDLSVFEGRYCNDQTGAPAFDPSVLLKIVIYAYSRGIKSSRDIAQACRENILFMALSADTQPHYLDLMKQKIDTAEGRYQYSRRMGIVEPVFANNCDSLRFKRFSLRTKQKVDI